MISLKSKIYVSGHKGLVGSAIVRQLKSRGYKNVICKTRKELDLTNQNKVLVFLKKTKPDFIFLAAAKVGGIYSNNKYKADYIYENLSIQTNIIHSAYLCGIKNLIFTSSVAIYGLNKFNPNEEHDVDPFNHYGKSKWQAELMIRDWYKKASVKKSFTIIRPTVLFG